jgi:lipopolysaccharide/colanic/teichoic acid biosynthesis glycosyltransferase
MPFAANSEAARMPTRRAYRVAKRTLDIGITALTLAVAWPLWILIAVLIRLSSQGPAHFVQERVGKDGQPFRMYKFRTLYVDHDRAAHETYMRSYVNGSSYGAETLDSVRKPVVDSQVTAIGRFLRTTSLDELPQIINVLKGEMSLVGPRPNVPWEVEEYQSWHLRRLEVVPGMTGLAQVRGRSCLTFDDIVEYDIEYIEHRSVLLDLKILFWTVPMVLRGVGAS